MLCHTHQFGKNVCLTISLLERLERDILIHLVWVQNVHVWCLKTPQYLKKILFSYSIISFLGISTKDTSSEIKIGTRVFTVALFLMVRYFKQLQCPFTGDRKTIESYNILKNWHTNMEMNQGSFLYPVL